MCVSPLHKVLLKPDANIPNNSSNKGYNKIQNKDKNTYESDKKNEYVIDNYFELWGYTILHLPPSYCVFNPIEIV